MPQCSLLLVHARHPGALTGGGTAAAAPPAEYLFHSGIGGEDLFDREPDLDLGHKSMQCGRRPDALKLWLCWKRMGTAGFAARLELARDLAEYLAGRLAGDSRFALVPPRPASFNVCFWYLPPSLRAAAVAAEAAGGPGTPGTEALYQRLGTVTATLYSRYVSSCSHRLGSTR